MHPPQQPLLLASEITPCTVAADGYSLPVVLCYSPNRPLFTAVVLFEGSIYSRN